MVHRAIKALGSSRPLFDARGLVDLCRRAALARDPSNGSGVFRIHKFFVGRLRNDEDPNRA